ncbi:sigma-70 family RNA polymerase sigma factor [Paenibacillus timonensis]|uniref:Sigma-70 family RNA polymerase sigma factor n=1 Tax=Paenibacillus timonensis TaxID=225915 RepID=A0ABW3SFH9_9BACL|nr:sigma-70 family RNA polymerase sigma factor [Paenibacillus timonensis]MCH1641861.1 sigma-70 family RNA polymerase sigma factor [Paenibacillus timonensis]
MEEREWAAAACSGDEQAFYQLISLHRRKLYGIAYSYLRNESDALEAIQETVCKAWIKCRRLKDPEAFIPWLIRILINCCIDELKRRKRVLPYVAETVQSTGEMVSVFKMDLDSALDRLKPKYRHVLTLKYYQDMTLAEIARVLDCPEGTVKTWLHQGLKQLRRHMNVGGELYYG